MDGIHLAFFRQQLRDAHNQTQTWRFHMKQILFLSVLLLGATWAMAQSDQPQASPSDSTATTQSDATPTSSGGNTTVQGCLSGSDGNYMLTDKNGKSYELAGDTAKLAEHVGHEIKVTGSMSASSMSPSGGGTETDASKQTLQVSSFKHVSKTCSSGGGMSH
jgi:hypothetical protein